MRVTELLSRTHVKIPLRGGTRDEVIDELVTLVAADGAVADSEAARQAVLERERAGSTGIGHGFALPHAKLPELERCVLALGRTAEPVDFGSADEKPVTLVVLLLAPAGDTSAQVQILARLSRLFEQEDLRRRLNRAASGDEVVRLLQEYEALIAAA